MHDPGVKTAPPESGVWIQTSPDTLAQMAYDLTLDPAVAEAYVRSPETVASPDIFKAAVAGLQRNALVTNNPTYLRRNREAIQDGLVKKGYWRQILHSVAAGHPHPVDLQLVTWSLDAGRPDLRLIRPSLARTVATKAHIDGLAPLQAWGDTSANDAWRAVQAYVRNSPNWRTHFNAPQGHLLAIAQVDVMRGLELFDFMKIDTADPLLRAAIAQERRFMELAREGGHLHLLPARVRWTMRALEEFEGDQATWMRGSKTIERVQGRTWRFLAEPEAEQAFERYLGGRTELREHANECFHDWYAADPEVLGKQLDHWMKTAQANKVAVVEGGTQVVHSADDVIDGLKVATYNTNATEMVGVLWSVLTMRRREPAISALIDETNEAVKGLLEPYVIDGFHLVGTWQDPHWLPVVALHSWANEDPRVSVFTAEGKPVIDDRREAGAALSDQIKLRMEQASYNSEDNTVSEGYEALRPHVGMCIALYHVLDLLTSERATPPMRINAYQDFLTMVDRVPKDQRGSVYTGLPDEVQRFIDHRGYLAQRLGVR